MATEGVTAIRSGRMPSGFNIEIRFGNMGSVFDISIPKNSPFRKITDPVPAHVEPDGTVTQRAFEMKTYEIGPDLIIIWTPISLVFNLKYGKLDVMTAKFPNSANKLINGLEEYFAGRPAADEDPSNVGGRKTRRRRRSRRRV